jgi:hypothetical protein
MSTLNARAPIQAQISRVNAILFFIPGEVGEQDPLGCEACGKPHFPSAELGQEPTPLDCESQGEGEALLDHTYPDAMHRWLIGQWA